MKIKLICQQCNNEYYVYPSHKNRKFCSCKCYYNWMSQNTRGENNINWNGGNIILICEECGQEYYVNPSLKNISHFCSNKCHGKWQSKNLFGENSPSWNGGNIILICEECGQEYYVIPARKDSRFCSHECYGDWLRKNNCGENHPSYKITIKLICEECGQEYYVKPGRNGRKFCSKECQYKWMSQSLEFKQRISAGQQGILYEEWEEFVKDYPYCPDFNEECKESNRDKYDRLCFLTGLPEEENITSTGKQKKLAVHHYDMDKGQGCNGKKWKLVPLCMSWHGKVHNELWEARIIWLLDNVWKNNNYLW